MNRIDTISDGDLGVTNRATPRRRGRWKLTGQELDSESAWQFSRRYLAYIQESHDLLGFDAGDENLYRYISNNGPNRIDPLGLAEFEIKVTRKARPLGRNGGADFVVKWILKKTNENEKLVGSVIQHVKITYRVVNKNGEPIITDPDKGKPLDAEFWEGWQIGYLKAHPDWFPADAIGDADKGGNDKFSIFDFGDATCGIARIRGKVKFVPNYQIYDYEKNQYLHGWKRDPIGFPYSGGIPFKLDKPEGWNENDAKDHILEVSWNTVNNPPRTTTILVQVPE